MLGNKLRKFKNEIIYLLVGTFLKAGVLGFRFSFEAWICSYLNVMSQIQALEEKR